MAGRERARLALAGTGTRVVLVGTGRHDAPPGEEPPLPPIESAARTVLALGEALVECCGLAPENLTTVIDPADPEAMYAAIESAARAARDVLLIGYVGHGVKDTDDLTLFLATRATTNLTSRYPESQALAYTRINSLLRQCEVQHVMVILDCCFAGKAEPLRANSLLLAAAGKDETALAPAGADYTEFSGELIRLLRQDRAPGEALTVTRLAWQLDASRQLAGRQTVIHHGGPVAGLVLAGDPQATAQARMTRRDVTSPSQESPSIQCPYPGLSAFRLNDAWCYFGREKLVESLLHQASNMLHNPGPLLIHGGSGAGKSSLLQAGLLGSIRYGDLDIPGSELWPAAVMTPGSDPQEALRRALAGVIKEHCLGIQLPPLDSADQALAAVSAVRERHAAVAGLETSRFILIVDQLEELFTHTQEEDRRRTFMDSLRLLCAPDEGGVPTALVIAGMRSEFTGRVAFWVDDLPGLRNQVLVDPMTPRDLRRAVQDPAAATGCSVEDALTDRLLDDLAKLGMSSDTRSTTPALPFLSHAMRRAFLAAQENGQSATPARLTIADYTAVGGVSDAIAGTAEEIYRKLGETGQMTCRTMFSHLIEVPAVGQVTRRYTPMRELRAITGDQRTADRIVEMFCDAQLLAQEDGTAWITHDILLTAWPRLADWVTEDRHYSRVRQETTAAADDWDRNGRDTGRLYRRGRLEEAEKWLRSAAQRGEVVEELYRLFIYASARSQSTAIRVRRAGVVILAVLLMVASGAAYEANTQAHRAGVQAHNASVQAALARQQARVATAGQIAVQSESLDDSGLGKANLLAAEAWALDPDQLSTDALADALQRPRGLVLQAHTAAVTGVAFADGGKEVVTASNDGDAYLWDTASGARVAGPLSGYQIAPVPALAVSPNGQTIETSIGNIMYLWDTSGAPAGGTDFGKCLDDLTAAAFSPDGRYLAVACPGGNSLAKLVDGVYLDPLVPSAAIRELITPAPVSAVGFSPDGRTLATATGDKVQLFTVATGAAGPLLSGDTAAVTEVAFSPDRRTLITASRDGTAQLWNAVTGRQEAVLRSGGGAVTAVAFSPDGSAVVTASASGTARLWSTANGALTATLTGHTGAILAAAFDPKLPIVVTAGSDFTARIWDTRTGTQIAVLRGDAGRINAIAISPDGRTLATASDDTTAHLWDLTFSEPSAVLHTGSRALASLGVKLDANGSTYAAGYNPSTDCGSPDPDANVTSEASSPDGTRLVEAYSDGTTWFCTGGANDVPKQLGGSGTVHTVVFAPKGRTFATADAGGTIWLWNSSTGTAVSELTGTAGAVTHLAFSPDGETLASGSADGTVRLWNAITGTSIATLIGPGPITALAFSSDGLLAAADKRGTVDLWHEPTATLSNLCARIGGPISRAEWTADAPGVAYEKVC